MARDWLLALVLRVGPGPGFKDIKGFDNITDSDAKLIQVALPTIIKH